MTQGLDRPLIERARLDDRARVAELLYESAIGLYDRFAGGREGALRAIEAALERPGNSASLETVTVARVGGEAAGAMATFPVAEAHTRGRRFVRIALRASPPRSWWRMWRASRIESAAVPPAPADAFYVDALACDPRFRRRGVALALMAAAEQQARDAALPRVALITELDNETARSLYRRAGFAEGQQHPPTGRLPGFVALSKRVS